MFSFKMNMSSLMHKKMDSSLCPLEPIENVSICVCMLMIALPSTNVCQEPEPTSS